MKTLIALMLITGAALAQVVLDPTMSGAYTPRDYSDYICGNTPQPTVLAERENADHTISTMVKAVAVCSAGGRGSGNRYRLTCTVVTFASDRYTILPFIDALGVSHPGERVFSATWLQRTGTPVACPPL